MRKVCRLKNKSEDDFDEIELKLLNEKYPKFIVDAISSSNVKKTYRVLDNEIIIY